MVSDAITSLIGGGPGGRRGGGVGQCERLWDALMCEQQAITAERNGAVRLHGRLGVSPMAAVITVDHLHKAYGRLVAVDDISFGVERGEIFGILGPNGAGKTTTVECVQGLRGMDGGTVRVLGLDPVTEATELRQRIGSQLQDSALPGRLKVAESLELFAAFARHPVDCDRLLDRWRLREQRDQAFDSLSGGQRQRLFIALAFVNSPEVVFLDELTQGLDPQARRGDLGSHPRDP